MFSLADFGQLGAFESLGAVAPGLYEQASLYMDFQNNAARVSGAWGSAVSSLATTRAAVAQMDTSDGWWGQFAINAPRWSDKGLLIEGVRTNSIRNNTMTGAVAGSPGTFPTNWSSPTQLGISQTVVAVGNDHGVDYIDVRFQGTSTGAGSPVVFFDTVTGIAATPGQAWTESFFLALIGGSFANVLNGGTVFNVYEFDAAQGFLRNFSQLTPALTTTLQRMTHSNPYTTGASCAFLRPGVFFSIAGAGLAIDVTLRIGWPQLELGAFMTSPIKTTNAAVIRNPDVINAASFGWYTQGPGTLWTEFARDVAGNGDFNTACLSQTVNTDWVRLWRWSGNLTAINWTETVASSNQCSNNLAYVDGGTHKIAGVRNLNDFNEAFDGTLGVVDTAGTLCVPTQLNVGHAGGGGQLNGYLRRLAYWNSRLTDAQIQALTAP